MTKKKKDVECHVPTWMMRKAKKAMIYKARKDRKEGGSEKGTGKTEKGKSYL